MLVRLAFGRRSGEVIDFMPTEARAMLADGLATLPDAVLSPVVEPVSRVEAREDRGTPRGKRRAHR